MRMRMCNVEAHREVVREDLVHNGTRLLELFHAHQDLRV